MSGHRPVPRPGRPASPPVEKPGFLPGFDHGGSAQKPPSLSTRARRFYDTYMASTVWAAKKAPVLSRAFGRCERCGCAGQVLEVHHLSYERFGGDELLADLIALCRSCHCAADTERSAAAIAEVERRRREAEDDFEEGLFRSWVRRKYGAEFFDGADPDEIRDAREEYHESWNDRDGSDY